MDLLEYNRIIFKGLDYVINDSDRCIYYDRLHRLIIMMIGGGIFPVIELNNPLYYGCDGSARCDGFYVSGDKCYFIDRSFGSIKSNLIDTLPFYIIKKVIHSLLDLDYHFSK